MSESVAMIPDVWKIHY